MAMGKAPIAVRFVALLALIGGVFNLVAALVGAIGIWNTDVRDELDLNRAGAVAFAILAVVMALIYFAVSRGLKGGSRFARFLAGIVAVVGLVAGITGLIRADGSGSRVGILVGIAIDVLILVCLYGLSSSRAYFRSA